MQSLRQGSPEDLGQTSPGGSAVVSGAFFVSTTQSSNAACSRWSSASSANGIANGTWRDRARRHATPATRRDHVPGRRGRAGTGETPETGVVWLITQRSQVQILPPLPGQRPLPILEGASACRVLTESWFLATSSESWAPVSSVISTDASDPPMISSASAFARCP